MSEIFSWANNVFLWVVFFLLLIGGFAPANAMEGEVDIDSWSMLTGQVTRATCLYTTVHGFLLFGKTE